MHEEPTSVVIHLPFLLDSLIPITHPTILFFKLPMPLNLPGSLKFFIYIYMWVYIYLFNMCVYMYMYMYMQTVRVVMWNNWE